MIKARFYRIIVLYRKFHPTNGPKFPNDNYIKFTYRSYLIEDDSHSLKSYDTCLIDLNYDIYDDPLNAFVSKQLTELSYINSNSLCIRK